MLQIGAVILQERRRLQITQETLASYCQVSKASVSKWEKGLSYPDITLLPKIASYFELTVDELLGFERQLSKESIQHHYYEFASRFGKESFESVFIDVEEQVKLYYHDPAFLLQMSILLLNHHMLSSDSSSILQKANRWLERIRQVSEDVWVLRQANSLQATVSLMQSNPETTLELLDGVIKPSIGDEILLSTAYEQLGNQEEAKRVIQVMMYQNVIQLVGSSPLYLRLSTSNPQTFNETIHRINGLIELYALRTLHPNMCLQFYFSVAQCAALSGNHELLYPYLKKYVDVCIHDLLPFSLRGDEYFDLLDDWLEQLDLGTNALRNTEIIKRSIIESMDADYFEPFRQDDEMQELRQRLRFGLEGRS
ncbi:transcriptional regulator [Sporosarcina sp. P16a]|uniref:helix-turn-helix domain-containing protein n=1 Tax=unclassified Sporosarcina TaxID=2647733 RepID=UPI000C1704B0|nr:MULTISPECIES: helix-turn-helix transcriptional regulator [unclassified Sporosarcina]PIC68264.1 transcriptional regulator [Sporosarcina sp. P16a]PIC94005.1 transcriptional regulator [Sporosarcina sp. P25]